MFKRTIQLVLVVYLITSALWAADAPFVGEWKLNSSKSKLPTMMKVESAAGDKYAFDFDGGGNRETIAPDGTDQPGQGGTTVAVTIEAPDSWKVVRKKDGRIILTANWKLSKDGSTLTDDARTFGTDGSSGNFKYAFKRTAGTSGFVGTWESTSTSVDSFVMQVQPYEGDGLSFIVSAEGATINVKFDVKDYPVVGPNVPPGLASSARLVNGHTLEITNKFNGKAVGTREVSLSSDGKTLTMTLPAPKGRSEPSILVFERQ